jgi:hypothetical protein
MSSVKYTCNDKSSADETTIAALSSLTRVLPAAARYFILRSGVTTWILIPDDGPLGNPTTRSRRGGSASRSSSGYSRIGIIGGLFPS